MRHDLALARLTLFLKSLELGAVVELDGYRWEGLRHDEGYLVPCIVMDKMEGSVAPGTTHVNPGATVSYLLKHLAALPESVVLSWAANVVLNENKEKRRG